MFVRGHVNFFSFSCISLAYSQPSYRDLACCSWKILSEISSADDYVRQRIVDGGIIIRVWVVEEPLANHSTNLSLWPWSTIDGVVLSPNADS